MEAYCKWIACLVNKIIFYSLQKGCFFFPSIFVSFLKPLTDARLHGHRDICRILEVNGGKDMDDKEFINDQPTMNDQAPMVIQINNQQLNFLFHVICKRFLICCWFIDCTIDSSTWTRFKWSNWYLRIGYRTLNNNWAAGYLNIHTLRYFIIQIANLWFSTLKCLNYDFRSVWLVENNCWENVL